MAKVNRGAVAILAAAVAAVITCGHSFGADGTPPALTFVLMDGSVITGSPNQPELLVDTEFGRLKIPLTKLESFTPGLDNHPDLAEKIGTLVAALDSPEPAPREQAKQELIQMGPSFQAIIAEYGKDINPDRKAAVAAILEAYKSAPAGVGTAPILRQDQVKTALFPVVGSISEGSFKITCPYGQLSVDLNAIRKANRSAKSTQAPGGLVIRRIVVEASDGTKLAGQTDMVALAVDTPYGKVEVPLQLVDAMTVSDRPAEKPGARRFRIALWNGDRLEGNLSGPEAVTVRTEHGALSVPLVKLTRLQVEASWPKGPLPDALAKSLVLHYSFDKNEGEKISDGSGKEHHGKVHGAKWTEQARHGGGYVFDGTGAYLELPDAAKQKGPFTVSIWFTCQATADYASLYGGGGLDMPVDRNGIAITRSRDGDKLFLNVFGTPGLYTTWVERAQVDYMDGKWHHVVGTYDGESIAIYLDGRISDRDPTRIGNVSIDWTNSAHWLGKRAENAGPTWYWKGGMDEVMIFERALSPAEVRGLFYHRP